MIFIPFYLFLYISFNSRDLKDGYTTHKFLLFKKMMIKEVLSEKIKKKVGSFSLLT